jgi:hypothetical protein
MKFHAYVRYVLPLALVVFVLNKLVLRPWVLERDSAEALVVLVNSLPNFIEAIMGTLLLTVMALQLRTRFRERLGRLNDSSVYLIASALAGLYVVSQELKFHNLGGNNVYDPYDLLASLLGLSLVNMVFHKYGVAREPSNPRSRTDPTGA